MIISYLNEFLVPRYGDDLYLTFIDPTPEDKAARTTEMNAAAGAGVPIMTQNEARKNYLGLGPVEGGDQLMRPGTLVPSGHDRHSPKAKTRPRSSPNPRPWTAGKRKAIRIRTGGKTANSGAAQMRRALTEAFKKAIDKEPAYQFKSINELTHAEYKEHWKRFADRSEQAEAELQKVFRGINAKQREQVLENLDGATVDMLAFVANATKALDDLFDLKEWIGITINLANADPRRTRRRRSRIRARHDRRIEPEHPRRREHASRARSRHLQDGDAATTRRRSTSSRACSEKSSPSQAARTSRNSPKPSMAFTATRTRSAPR